MSWNEWNHNNSNTKNTMDRMGWTGVIKDLCLITTIDLTFMKLLSKKYKHFLCSKKDQWVYMQQNKCNSRYLLLPFIAGSNKLVTKLIDLLTH